MKSERLCELTCISSTSIVEAMSMIDANAKGILFVLDGKLLVGSITDGDIRRWILKSGDLAAPVIMAMNNNPKSIYEGNEDKASTIMDQFSISALPLINLKGELLNIFFLIDNKQYRSAASGLVGISVVIMAGGKGTRLYPYTKILPKPLIPIGEIPIVERVMDSFAEYGVIDFYMTVNYKKNMIQSYFAEIEKEYSIEFIEEDKPLGTGGSLKLLKKAFNTPIIVANCDCLIRTDYSQLYEHHIKSGNTITMVTSLKNDTIPYGVIYSNENGELERIDEKPTRSYLINTGMYVINPEMIKLIPDDTMFHMTELVENAMSQGYKVGMYPISEDSFLDMGEFAEMKRMEEKLNIQ